MPVGRLSRLSYLTTSTGPRGSTQTGRLQDRSPPDRTRDAMRASPAGTEACEGETSGDQEETSVRRRSSPPGLGLRGREIGMLLPSSQLQHRTRRTCCPAHCASYCAPCTCIPLQWRGRHVRSIAGRRLLCMPCCRTFETPRFLHDFRASEGGHPDEPPRR